MRTYRDLANRTASDISGQLAAHAERLARRLADVQHTLAVMSGKGGVGKSLVTANLAAALMAAGRSVGAVDADIHGPSLARLLGARGPLRVGDGEVEPARGAAGVRVMSMDLLLAGEETPVDWSGPRAASHVWRGALEANALREFLADTAWGELDYLLLDLAPGTDRLTPLRELLPRLDGLIVVTIPSRLSRFVVRKSLGLASELAIPVIGYVENMAGYHCPHCGELGELFDSEGETFADVECLARVPFDPRLGRCTEAGRPYVLEETDSAAGRAFDALVRAVENYCGSDGP